MPSALTLTVRILAVCFALAAGCALKKRPSVLQFILEEASF
jgi:hypothetical protein